MKFLYILLIQIFFFQINIIAQNPYLAGSYTGYELKHKWISDSSYIFYRINYSNCNATNSSFSAGGVFTCMSDSCNYSGSNNGWGALADSNLPTPHPLLKPCSNFVTQCDSPFLASSAISYKKLYFNTLWYCPSIVVNIEL